MLLNFVYNNLLSESDSMRNSSSEILLIDMYL